MRHLLNDRIILFIPVAGDDPRSHSEPRLQDSRGETDCVQLRHEGHVRPDSAGDRAASSAARRVVTVGRSTLGPAYGVFPPPDSESETA